MKILQITLVGAALVLAAPAFATYAAPEGNGHVDTASYAAPEGNGHVGDTA